MKFYQDNKEIFNILSEAISEGILIVNDQGSIVAANEPLEKMFGYEHNELNGSSINKLMPVRFHEKHRDHFNKFMQGSSQRKMAKGRALYGVCKNGEEIRVEIGLNPFKILDVSYMLALVFDITHRIYSENQIRELNSVLEDKIRMRTSELKETITKLEREVSRRESAELKAKEALRKEKELNEFKTNFVSLVSHEFKTPLSSILMSAVLVGKYTESDQQDKRDKHLEIIKNKVRNLDAILNDFLSVEKVAMGKYKYDLTVFNLSKVLNEVIYDANMMLKSGQRINYPENADEIQICQDEKVLNIILSNLINNAIKFSPENGLIDVQVEQGNKGILSIRIIDQGIGIPPGEQEHIFERYFRASNALITQGTGIGLNLVKDHLENLGGKIGFESIPDKGTTFIIELPDLSNKQHEDEKSTAY